MKNTELVKVEGILNYKEELDKVKKLTRKEYTVKEAAEYFNCTKSQIKGYHTNYRDLFGDLIRVEGVNGKQRTIISQDAMFLLAILLNKKTKVSEKTFKNVLARVVGQQMSMDETAATKETEKKTNKDNVIDFEDLKKKIESKSETDMPSIKIKMIPLNKLTKEKLDAMAKDAQVKLDNMKYIPKEIKDMLNSALQDSVERIEKGINLEEKLNNIINELDETDDSCRCEECLEQEFNEMAHEAAITRLELEANLDCQVAYVARYKEICSLLGVDDLEASIMIQRSIVKGHDIDKDILFHLIDEKSMEIRKKMGIIKQSVELLAEEKCDSIKEAYMLLVQELRYTLGKDLTELVTKKEYDEITKTIIINKEFENVMAIIHNYLAQ